MSLSQRAKLYYVFTDFFNGTLLTYLPLYLKNRFQYTGSEFGTVLLFAGIFAVLGILIGPMIVNTFKKEKSVMLIEFALMALAIILMANTNNYYLIILATGFCYLNRMAMYSVGDNMIGDIGREIGIPFGKFRSFGSIGWGLCFLVNGFLVTEHPSLFPIVWFSVSLLAILNLVFLKEKPKIEKQSKIVDVKTIKAVTQNRNAFNYLILGVMLYILVQTAPNFVNLLIQDMGGKVVIYSTITAFLVIIEFIVMFYAHEVRKKLQDQKYLELVAILLIAKMAVIVLAQNPILIYISAIVDPVIYGLILPFNPAFLKDNVPKQYNATILSIFGILSLITIALYSKFAGNIMQIFNTKVVFITFLAFAIIVFILIKVMRIDHKNKFK